MLLKNVYPKYADSRNHQYVTVINNLHTSVLLDALFERLVVVSVSDSD